MQHSIISFAIIAPFVWACAATFPPPTQRLADAQSAERSARELGAESVPKAQLSLALAQKQIAQAQSAMKAGDNENADSLLIRAKADAELALAQARERVASVERKEAVVDADKQRAANIGQGAVK